MVTRESAAESRKSASGQDPIVAALLNERRGYVMRGMAGRVKEVDDQIRLLGATPPADAPGTSRMPTTRARKSG